MSKTAEAAPTIWGKDESPVKGKTYSFVNPIKAKSSPVRETWKNRKNIDRNFITGRFVCEDNGSLTFVGHKVIGERRDPKKGNETFLKKSKRKYYFSLPKGYKLPEDFKVA